MAKTKKISKVKGYICDEYKGNRRKKNLSTSGWILTVLGIIVIAYFAIQYIQKKYS